MVSHETLYQWIWDCKKRGDREMADHLRHNGRHYTKRGNAYKTRGIIKNRVGIEERPAIVDEKKRFGDFEIDTVIGRNHKGALMTTNDRCTHILFIRKLEGKEAGPLASAAIETLSPYKQMLYTITADNGKEFAKHKRRLQQAWAFRFILQDRTTPGKEAQMRTPMDSYASTSPKARTSVR